MPHLGAEFEEGFVLGNRNVGMAMRLLIPLQVLHSIVECLVLASRLWCLLLLLLLSLPSVLLLLHLSLPSVHLLLIYFLCHHRRRRGSDAIETLALFVPE